MIKNSVLDFLEKEIEAEHIPGAVIHVFYQGETIVQEAIGNRVVYPEKFPMQLDTIFDLASLTKVVAALPAILTLIDNGEVRLDDRVAFFLPAFAVNGKEEVRLRHLLTHTSGLAAHRPFYLETLSKTEIIEKICQEPLQHQIGEKVIYSDLNFILLSSIVELVANISFAAFVKEKIFAPLGMHETSFNPTFVKTRYAATAYSEKHETYKQGIVHDDNAEVLGGISGHAGLFSTIKDLAAYAEMIENDGIYQGKRMISKAAIALSRENFTAFDTEYRGIGWIIKNDADISSCGDLFSGSSYGHTGFTGTSIWFDPEIKLHIILLTNRVHMKNTDAILRLRPRLHNLIRAYFS
ncbi:serine hydrolase domain-containing protein [Bacillus chungangensis]|uniref:CubicO group peptidase (Beta-lactamase class C family) n=1 Tax=Bacillus chungangensis TaxID=587633 RepID=A0ABT9X001_9BACI|nr:serine hydrolase domain-containing protein [Bacillus chungangensis]MDQ0178335.1 CubicO group peptidase (beta-lactamase class C family) [Bacillus chungangensis]